MLNWIQLTENALADYLAKDQLTLLTHYQVHTNPLPNLIKDVCAYIRSFVPHAWLNAPMQPSSIPDNCKGIACTLIVESLQTRIPELQLSNDQIRNADHARQSLLNLQSIWHQQSVSSYRYQHMESVRHRPHDANTQTLQGL